MFRNSCGSASSKASATVRKEPQVPAPVRAGRANPRAPTVAAACPVCPSAAGHGARAQGPVCYPRGQGRCHGKCRAGGHQQRVDQPVHEVRVQGSAGQQDCQPLQSPGDGNGGDPGEQEDSGHKGQLAVCVADEVPRDREDREDRHCAPLHHGPCPGHGPAEGKQPQGRCRVGDAGINDVIACEQPEAGEGQRKEQWEPPLQPVRPGDGQEGRNAQQDVDQHLNEPEVPLCGHLFRADDGVQEQDIGEGVPVGEQVGHADEGHAGHSNPCHAGELSPEPGDPVPVELEPGEVVPRHGHQHVGHTRPFH
jgi:hypothetical protein